MQTTGRVRRLLAGFMALAVASVGVGTSPATAATSPGEEPGPPAGGEAEVLIVGGDDADPGEYPFMTVVELNTEDGFSLKCGATLVDPLWVLTAAHCVDDVGPEQLAFLVGAHDRSSDDGERRFAHMTVLHPAFTGEDFVNDIALVQLTEPSTRPVVTIAGPTNAATWQAAQTGTVAGWGNTRTIPRFPDTLQEVDIPLVPDDACAQTSIGSRLVAPVMTCAGAIGRDACTGDSGGPLLVTSDLGFIQIGVSSFGSNLCGEPNAPGVYTEVPSFAAWIDSVVAPPVGQPIEVSHVVSCLGENARVDTNTVNLGDEPATYRMQFGALTPRQWTSAPGDWARSPITGRPDGSHDIVVRRNGVIISHVLVRTECDSATPTGNPHEIAVINSCRGGNGYLLFQFVNPAAVPRGYVIEFDSVPNRSTSAAAFGASVRAVTGRGDGVWGATVSSAGAVVATFSITVDCDL